MMDMLGYLFLFVKRRTGGMPSFGLALSWMLGQGPVLLASGRFGRMDMIDKDDMIDGGDMINRADEVCFWGGRGW